MFLIGAIILFRAAPTADEHETGARGGVRREVHRDRSGLKAVGTSFLVLFAAEWGDLSQILTLNLVAKYGSPLSVFLGSWLALLTVSGLAVLAGRVLLRYVKLSLLHYIAAGVCLVFAIVGVVPARELSIGANWSGARRHRLQP